MNLKVPSDISICGFNDLEASALVEPAITSVASPRFEMGQQAVELLMAASGQDKTHKPPIDIGYRIVERAST